MVHHQWSNKFLSAAITNSYRVVKQKGKCSNVWWTFGVLFTLFQVAIPFISVWSENLQADSWNVLELFNALRWTPSLCLFWSVPKCLLSGCEGLIKLGYRLTIQIGQQVTQPRCSLWWFTKLNQVSRVSLFLYFNKNDWNQMDAWNSRRKKNKFKFLKLSTWFAEGLAVHTMWMVNIH